MERQLTEREQYVIDTCISVFDMIHEKYNMSYNDISKLSKETGLCEYINIGFEILNSMGSQGVLIEVENYIKTVGGKLE